MNYFRVQEKNKWNILNMLTFIYIKHVLSESQMLFYL